MNSLPENYQPISPWGYFFLQILFNIPIIGFIFLIIFSLSNGNINRRNFARSYFCIYIIILILIISIISTGTFSNLLNNLTK